MNSLNASISTQHWDGQADRRGTLFEVFTDAYDASWIQSAVHQHLLRVISDKTALILMSWRRDNLA
jgi:hypothetical protein